MSRATDPRLEKIRAAIEVEKARGLPEELLELFEYLGASFDNAERLVGLFGVVDEGSVARADELYNEFVFQRGAKRTYH